MTNADKIRAMTDEELAHTLLHLDGGYNTFCTSFKECVEKVVQGEDILESQCEACVLRWLREEYPTKPRPEWQLRMLRTFGGDADVWPRREDLRLHTRSADRSLKERYAVV